MESKSLKADRYRRWAMRAGWIIAFLYLADTAAEYYWSFHSPWWVRLVLLAGLMTAPVLAILARRARPKRG